ncbi:SusC/RagA family TonB-linked outer membrane protein [Maribellus luteus]|uniref:SusC/RagA family TonB-linked outer membrane protein n=1 Tax=Maribellus luteus TaxID=2305463 RepID=A0A399T600_9BACT|nr:SusC/RagA family TonB-linked outer membrane protein [Maribellus luteus]RIJ50404.1 SusC/RagA family TonB-linked outer membrane protein [Maribellus luteus]
MEKSLKKGVLILFLFLFAGMNMIYAQQKSVTGSVKDESNIPLPGVTVMVKGTTNGTITNTDGTYSINVPGEEAILVFTFIGMKTEEVQVGTQTSINVTLASDVIGLEEVVAIGYGTSKRKDVTGSIAVADLGELRTVPVNNILETVKGSVPGLNVGSTNRAGQVASLSVRGQNSVSAGNNPLIVVDNAIYNGSIGDIANEDIESFTVLKDASAAAVYGARSANGVIIITTKKGKGINGKPQFNANLSYGIINEMKPLEVYDAEGYIKRMLDIRALRGDEADPSKVADYFANQVERDNYLATPDHKPTVADPYSLIRQNGFNKKANFSVANRTENSSYYISTSLTDQQGVIINDKYKNFTGRINMSNDLTDWLNLSINTMYSFRDFSGSSPAQSSTVGISPYASVYNEDGSYTQFPQQTTSYISPFWMIATSDVDHSHNLNAVVKATVKVPWVKGLTYSSTYSKSMRWQERNEFWDKNTRTGLLAKSTGSRYFGRDVDMLFDNMLSYNRLFADRHSVSATLLYSWEEYNNEFVRGSASQFDNDVLRDYKLGNGVVQTIDTGGGERGSIGQMARVNYSFDEKYGITGTVRRDGFSAFSKNKKWGVFPSVAVNWNISKESFMENISFLDNLGIRASYGSNGNQSITPYSTLAKVGTGKYLYEGDDTYSITQGITSFALNDLSWETTTGFNLGLNFGVLNNRLTGAIDMYKSNTTDQLFSLSLPYITGGSSIIDNLGDIENKGIEIELHSVNVQKGDFQWNSDFAFSLNRNKVITIYGEDDDGDGIEDDLISSNIFIGKSLGQIYTYRVIGMWQQEDVDNGTIRTGMNPGTYKLEDLPNEDGEYDDKITSENDRQHIGNSKANFRWSLNNNFTYKNFSLMVYLYSIWGGNDWFLSGANTPQRDPFPYREDVNKVVYDYWALDNTDAEFPRPDENSKATVRGTKYYDRSFIKLQKVAVSYDASDWISSKSFIKGLTLSVSGDNLATYAPHWVGLDPETGQGLNDSAVPSLQSFIFTTAIKF